MRFVDEFRDPHTARALLARLAETTAALGRERPLQIMEFCGGHTHAIFRYGINGLLPAAIELVHGPGCPVCVLPRERVDQAVALARREGVILASFGDALRVPGSRESLAQAKAAGADVRVVYSPLDALALARENPDREVVFFALGFETTMPSTALTVLAAEGEGVGNFSILCQHITTAPTLRALLEDPDLRLDGFIAPGHVGMVVGETPFDFVAAEYGRPLVISGFEPLDILQSLVMIVEQLRAGRARVENQYTRVVRPDGSPAGLAAMSRVFEQDQVTRLRGLGALEGAGVRLRTPFAAFDAERRFGLAAPAVAAGEGGPCGAVLKGRQRPWDCPHFATQCTPESPLGALMVSSEGACAAYHRFARREAAHDA